MGGNGGNLTTSPLALSLGDSVKLLRVESKEFFHAEEG
jgi:hypothetical protein